MFQQIADLGKKGLKGGAIAAPDRAGELAGQNADKVWFQNAGNGEILHPVCPLPQNQAFPEGRGLPNAGPGKDGIGRNRSFRFGITGMFTNHATDIPVPDDFGIFIACGLEDQPYVGMIGRGEPADGRAEGDNVPVIGDGDGYKI